MAKLVMSTKVANILALGGGVIIFIITAAITVYMTSEYNKGKDYKKLKDLFLKQGRPNLTLIDFEQEYESCKLCKFPFKHAGDLQYECVDNFCPKEIDPDDKSYKEENKMTCPTSKCSGVFCQDSVRVKSSKCDFLGGKFNICGKFDKIGLNWQLVKPIFRKNNTDIYILPHYQSWVISNYHDYQFAISSHTSTCPQQSASSQKWMVHQDKEWVLETSMQVTLN